MNQLFVLEFFGRLVFFIQKDFVELDFKRHVLEQDVDIDNNLQYQMVSKILPFLFVDVKQKMLILNNKIIYFLLSYQVFLLDQVLNLKLTLKFLR